MIPQGGTAVCSQSLCSWTNREYSFCMNWKIEGKSLVKEFEFDNFSQAIEFVNKIFPLAEEANHHPDLLIHSYKKVKVMMRTHSRDKITDKDYSLAKKIDTL